MNQSLKSANRSALRAGIRVMLLVIVSTPFAFGQRTKLKPGGVNFFSPQQEIELGRQVAQDAEKKVPMLRNQRVDDYLARLGRKLASFAPGEKYPYEFKCVNDASINAFALPGGFLFINRGTIEAADNEAELASVIGHEIGHVALRHGTNQATKAYIAQVPGALLGVLMGGSSASAIAAQVGASFVSNSVLLKYSRDDERQSDLMGAQILYDANYDPRYVAQFFSKLESRGGTDFFSSHPNPENRIKNINAEIAKLGAISDRAINDNGEFRSIRQYLKSLPPAPKVKEAQAPASGTGKIQKPPPPSDQLQSYSGDTLSFQFPDNWKIYQGDKGFMVAPDNGIIASGSASALAYGAVVETFSPDYGDRSSMSLKEATDQLIRTLVNSNPNMRVTDQQNRIRVGGRTALSKMLGNESPVGGSETDWLVAILRPEGLVYFVFVAPQKEFAAYEAAFQQMLDSVQFPDQ